MRVFRGFHYPGLAPACACTIGNFDGVHRGHQAMLALLINEARHRGLPSCVLTFERQRALQQGGFVKNGRHGEAVLRGTTRNRLPAPETAKVESFSRS